MSTSASGGGGRGILFCGRVRLIWYSMDVPLALSEIGVPVNEDYGKV
jgi:hypothetical protein